jgi:hypothetical protein
MLRAGCGGGGAGAAAGGAPPPPALAPASLGGGGGAPSRCAPHTPQPPLAGSLMNVHTPHAHSPAGGAAAAAAGGGGGVGGGEDMINHLAATAAGAQLGGRLAGAQREQGDAGSAGARARGQPVAQEM